MTSMNIVTSLDYTSIYDIITKEDKDTLKLLTTGYLEEFVMEHRDHGMAHRERWYILDLIYVGHWNSTSFYTFSTVKLMLKRRAVRYAIGRGEWK